MSAAPPLLDVRNVSLAFKGVKALTDLSFAVPRGEICALIGPNGAGKSSLLNVINGVYRADAGEITIDGEPFHRPTPMGAARRGVGRTFQNNALFRRMSVLDNVLTGLSTATSPRSSSATATPSCSAPSGTCAAMTALARGSSTATAASADLTFFKGVLMPSTSTPDFERQPKAHRITSDAEAIAVARDLAAVFATGAADRDRERRLPVAELERFSASGLWGITVPKGYGGAGVSYATLAEVIATVSAADPSLGQIPQNHLAALDAIRVSGSEAQKVLWFGRVLEGDRLGNAFSEKNSRHVGAFETTLRASGEGYVVSGDKFYATGALFAHFVHIGAVDEANRVHLAVADRDAPGLTVVDSWSGFGQRTTASGNVALRDVRVGPEAVIPAWKGGEQPSSNGAVSQLIQAAVDLGIAQGAFAETIGFVRTRSRPWIDSGQEHAFDDVFTIHGIGDLAVRLHAAEAMLARAGHAVDAILDDPTEAAVAETAVSVAKAKVLTTEIAILAANKLHELAGTRSVLMADNLDRHWRNARTHTLHDPVRWKYFHVGNHALNGVAPPRHAWS